MVTRSNGTAVFLPNSVPFFPRFVIGTTAILRNGIRNFILSSTVYAVTVSKGLESMKSYSSTADWLCAVFWHLALALWFVCLFVWCPLPVVVLLLLT